MIVEAKNLENRHKPAFEAILLDRSILTLAAHVLANLKRYSVGFL